MTVIALVNKLEEASKAYYDGNPIMSDAEFDALCQRLALLAPTHPFLKELGKDGQNGWTKAEHIMLMGSQNKANEEEEFRAWAAKNPGPYSVQHKLDGASLELQYIDGKLDAAITRGNGTVGDDITINARIFKGVPLHLATPYVRLAVRGEVVILHEDFYEFFAETAANARNAAVGTMKRLDGEGCEHLTFIAYDAKLINAKGEEEEIETNTEVALLFLLTRYGFRTVWHAAISDVNVICDMRNTAPGLRSAINYDVDGLVVKTLNRKKSTSMCPDHQIAFKFQLDNAATTLRSVEWSQNGRTFTPVAICDPVQLNGTTVTRASLANIGLIQDLDLCIGDTVLIEKRGEIIPKIMKAVASDESRGAIIPPLTCPKCGRDLEMDGAFLICPGEDCPAVLAHRFLAWFDALEIKGMGPAMAEAFTEHCSSLVGLYDLLEDIAAGNLLYTKAEQKFALTALAKKDVSFPKYLKGLDIPGIGEHVGEKLVAAGITEPHQILAMQEDVAGLGPLTFEALQRGFASVLGDAIDIRNRVAVHKALASGGPLAGEVFCFTGELNTMKRGDAEKLVRGAGGDTKTSITKAVTYLVTNDTGSGSRKNAKAAELGVRVINEEQFLAWTEKGVKP